jgi:hypothetical protein
MKCETWLETSGGGRGSVGEGANRSSISSTRSWVDLPGLIDPRGSRIQLGIVMIAVSSIGRHETPRRAAA